MPVAFWIKISLYFYKQKHNKTCCNYLFIHLVGQGLYKIRLLYNPTSIRAAVKAGWTSKYINEWKPLKISTPWKCEWFKNSFSTQRDFFRAKKTLYQQVKIQEVMQNQPQFSYLIHSTVSSSLHPLDLGTGKVLLLEAWEYLSTVEWHLWPPLPITARIGTLVRWKLWKLPERFCNCFLSQCY